LTGFKTQLEASVNAHWFSRPLSNQKNWIDQKLEQHLFNKRHKQLLLNRTQRPPVIVVGNLVVGGAGKTPLILQLAKQLALEFGPGAIICSGYGSQHYKKHPTRAVRVYANSAPQSIGDEAVLLAKKVAEFSDLCAVYAAKQRNHAYQLACSESKKLGTALRWVLSDDGLQHFDLPRALQIVCVDNRGFGNERVLPLGPLREPLSVLNSMDAIVVANPSLEMTQYFTSFGVPIVHSITVVTGFINLLTTQFLQVDQFREFLQAREELNSSSLLAGIATPKNFFELFYNCLSITDRSEWEERPLRDHAPIDETMAQQLKNSLVVMTEKDAVKWQAFAGSNWWAMCIERRPDTELFNILRKVLQ
jgi:tetraacyldisaccharide 4'-kinase